MLRPLATLTMLGLLAVGCDANSSRSARSGDGEGGGATEGEGEAPPPAQPAVGCLGLEAVACAGVQGCQWLPPGCDDDLPAAGCLPTVMCTWDRQCPQGSVCRAFTHDPCFESPDGCEACGGVSDVCVPEDEAPAPSCDDTKMRTSGMAESFAQGARCDFLYLCTALADREPFESLVLEHFPEAECAEGRDCLEHMGAEICACDEGATGHCKLWIEEIDAAEAAAGCTLSRNRQVNHLTCAGDL